MVLSARRAIGLGIVAAVALGCAGGDPPSYTRLEGAAPAMVSARGATLVVFWATWCPPCREELPSLRALARDLPASIALVTYGEDEDEGPVRAHFGGDPPPELRLTVDHDRRAASAFGVEVLPAAFLAVNGRLVARFAGPRDWNSRGMRRLLTRLAAEGARNPSAREARPGVDGPGG